MPIQFQLQYFEIEPYGIGTVRDSLNGIFTSLMIRKGLATMVDDLEDVVVEVCWKTIGTFDRTANEMMIAVEIALRATSSLRRILDLPSFKIQNDCV